MFHVVQSAGVLTTTIAAGYDIKSLVWIGVGLNIFASLINIFERTNDTISKKLFKNIQSIKNGTYIDEGMIVEVDSNAGEDVKPISEKYENENSKKDLEKNTSNESAENTLIPNPKTQNAINSESLEETRETVSLNEHHIL
jgi:hypothetical protein